MMPPLVSYVVSVFNKREYLAATLASIRAQAAFAGIEYEIIFADDASDDESVEFLQAEAARDPRVKVIENDANEGPAIRINQAARAARGAYILPLDADDLLPRNGARFFLDLVERHHVDIVFGRARRGVECADIPAAAAARVIDDPLTFCAANHIVHMGFLVRADIWRAAGGADETIFIQDQSLPLRLCSVAARIAMINAVVYCLRPAAAGNLSRNIAQQHHDRFLSVFHLLESGAPRGAARGALARQAVSALWKLRRDDGRVAPHLSIAFLRYAMNRLFSIEPSIETLRRLSIDLATIPGVRRVPPPARA